jgi:hypothetical protein
LWIADRISLGTSTAAGTRTTPSNPTSRSYDTADRITDAG